MFAAVLMLAISCSNYDDSALLGRVDELEDRVEGHEQRLSELEQKVSSINESYKALSAMLNGGVIKDVNPFNESDGSGYVITIQYSDGTTASHKIYNGTKGETGEAPAVELKKEDETGRYYWVINGKEPASERLYADVLAPQLKIDEDSKFQISYDGGKTWEEIGVFGGEVGSDIEMTVDKDDNGNIVSVTFTQGENVWTYEVGASNISVKLTVDGEEVEPFGAVAVAVGQTATITVAVEGASENAIVTAELQNAGGYKVTVDDMDINVESVDGGANKLIINVLDGGACYHTWVALEEGDSNSYAMKVVQDAWIEVAECDDTGYYVPVAYGAGFEAFENVPVKLTVNVFIAEPAKQPVTFDLGVHEWTDIDASQIDLPSTVTINKGDQSAVVPLTVTSRKGMSGDMCIAIEISANGETANPEYGYFFLANNFTKKATLTADNYHNYLGGAADAWCDGEYTASSTQETSWSDANFKEGGAYAEYLPTIKNWGIYIDIDLPESACVVGFAYCHRSGDGAPANRNGEVGAIKFGGKAAGDADFAVIGNVSQAADELPTTGSSTGYWQKCYRNSSYWYKLSSGKAMDTVRFGIVEAFASSMADKAGASGWVDATEYPWVSACMAELEVWIMY